MNVPAARRNGRERIGSITHQVRADVSAARAAGAMNTGPYDGSEARAGADGEKIQRFFENEEVRQPYHNSIWLAKWVPGMCVQPNAAGAIETPPLSITLKRVPGGATRMLFAKGITAWNGCTCFTQIPGGLQRLRQRHDLILLI